MVSATVSRTVTALSRTGAEVTAALEIGAAGAFVIPPRHSTAVIRIIAKALPYIFCSSGGQLTLLRGTHPRAHSGHPPSVFLKNRTAHRRIGVSLDKRPLLSKDGRACYATPSSSSGRLAATLFLPAFLAL